MEPYAVIAIFILYFIFLAGLPPFVQWRAAQEEIDVQYFKTIKIKKLSFFFRGIGGKDAVGGDVQKDGVILPMFVLQVAGYCVAVVSTAILLPLFLTGYVSDKFVFIFQSCLLGAEIVACIVLMFVCSYLSKKRKRQAEMGQSK